MEAVYFIKYSYYTGSSFGSEDREEVLEFYWSSLEKAKEALQRIKEHYRWYKNVEDHYAHEKVEKPKWHNITGNYIDKYNEHYMINLELDDGTEVHFWAPWCGYFEGLYDAKIVVNGEDTDFKI
jgi:hypothetical protein